MPLIFLKKEVTDASRVLVIQKQSHLSESKAYNVHNILQTKTLNQLEPDFSSHCFYVLKSADEIVGSVDIKIEGEGRPGKPPIFLPTVPNVRRLNGY